MEKTSSNLSAGNLEGYNYLRITGNTFACRDEIKRAGGQWDADSKSWVVPIPSHSGGRRIIASLTYSLSKKGCRFEARKTR